MRGRIIALAAGLLGLIICGQAFASVRSDFQKIWAERFDSYSARRAELTDRQHTTADRLIASVKSESATAPQDLQNALIAARAISSLSGHGVILQGFRKHMDGKPSSAASEAWMQDQVAALHQRIKDADTAEAQLRAMQQAGTINVGQWLGALEKVTMDRGYIEGASDELVLINQNLTSFYRAIGEEKAESRARWAAALRGMGDALVRQQQAAAAWANSSLPSTTINTRCVHSDYVTNCTSN